MINLPNYNWLTHTTRDTHQVIAQHCPDNGIIVECGTYMGRSAAYIINSIVQMGKTCRYFAIDNFQFDNIPRSSLETEGILKYSSYREAYDDNLRIMGIEQWVTTIQGDTLESVALFEDNSVFCLYIDDTHNGEWVTRELDAWMPKMVKDGIIIGDDFYDPAIAAAFLKRFGPHVQLSNPHANNGCIVFLKDIYD